MSTNATKATPSLPSARRGSYGASFTAPGGFDRRRGGIVSFSSRGSGGESGRARGPLAEGAGGDPGVADGGGGRFPAVGPGGGLMGRRLRRGAFATQGAGVACAPEAWRWADSPVGPSERSSAVLPWKTAPAAVALPAAEERLGAALPGVPARPSAGAGGCRLHRGLADRSSGSSHAASTSMVLCRTGPLAGRRDGLLARVARARHVTLALRRPPALFHHRVIRTYLLGCVQTTGAAILGARARPADFRPRPKSIRTHP